MGIKIIDEPDIYLTREEHERARREYEKCCSMMVDPPSFETWVRRRKESATIKMPYSGLEPPLGVEPWKRD